MVLKLCKKNIILFHVNWSAVEEQLYLTMCWKCCWPNPTCLAALSLFLEEHGNVFLK